VSDIVLDVESLDQADFDTCANLLYEDGRKEEAIEWEGRAVTAENALPARSKGAVDPIFAQTLEKMQNGIPTWDAS
jgi:hypothetical protein